MKFFWKQNLYKLLIWVNSSNGRTRGCGSLYLGSIPRLTPKLKCMKKLLIILLVFISIVSCSTIKPIPKLDLNKLEYVDSSKVIYNGNKYKISKHDANQLEILYKPKNALFVRDYFIITEDSIYFTWGNEWIWNESSYKDKGKE